MKQLHDPLGFFTDRPWLTGGLILAVWCFVGLPAVFAAFALALLYVIAVSAWKIAQPLENQAMRSGPPTAETPTINVQPPPED